jgi:ABC-type transport system involved in cytochrome c biogenesis permease component
MRMLSVTDRELRSSSRQSFTYSLRVLGVLGLLIVLGLFCLDGDLGPEIGERLFGALHGALFLGIWIFAPLLTADCISRERREGTLPLLFLTNLNPRDIVVAKGFAHGLRAFTLWLAVLPVLAVPLVAGGVGWAEVIVSGCINAAALCLAIGAGVAASAATRGSNRALALAGCLAAFLLVAFITALPVLAFSWLISTGTTAGWSISRILPYWRDWGPIAGLGLSMNWDGVWQQMFARLRAGPWGILKGFGATTLVCVGALLVLIRFAAWRVKRVWREEPASVRVEWLKKKLFTPVLFRSVLGRWLDWQLARNPIGWLEQRSWSGRLIVWSWFAIVICIYSSLFANLSLYQRIFTGMQELVASLLAVSIGLSAAGSFRRERETGVLELLLVSPISEWQIIGGRVRGLWMQFLPAMILLFSVWIYCSSFLGGEEGLGAIILFVSTFATLPVTGLYFSLTRSTLIVSFIGTLIVSVVLPTAASGLGRFWFGSELQGGNQAAALVIDTLLPCAVQLLLAGFLAMRLHHRLRFRTFAVDRKG